jgi:beta-glucuronidase
MLDQQISTSERAALYPRMSAFRQRLDLSGFWDFRFDPEDEGEPSGWSEGLIGHRPIAVPASWNDQFEGWRDYLGRAWYQTRFDLPWGWLGRRIRLRFGSVNYLTEAWLNGVPLGRHEGGHLPFEFDATPQVRPEDNLLVVRVDGELAPDRVPPGNIPSDPRDVPHPNFPETSFDFFPFCGIQRPVMLYATPHDAVVDLALATEIEDGDGLVHVSVGRTAAEAATARLILRGHGAQVTEEVQFSGETAEAQLRVPQAALWSSASPNLYELTLELVRNGEAFDSYSLPVGIRTVSVEGDSLLLNGSPIRLTGFGRHEDFPVSGRGLVPAVITKDYALMEWVGANSFRTSHYPYSDEMMDLADRLGFLVIDETPAVGLFFAEEGLKRRLALCRQSTQELIDRDRNHPSVIMWSLANEPMSTRPGHTEFFRFLYDLAKSRDSTRPVTIASRPEVDEGSFEFCDVVCINRYYGWYTELGQLDAARRALSAELDGLHERYPKPFVLTEFGADALTGCHAQPPEMFSEEYQAEMLSCYIEVLDSKPFVVGQHVWNLCDFKTGQGVRRPGGMNLKGVFTRDRRPKLAAHRLRELWKTQGP